ncbi:hypothetical protein [Pseudophaeobacter leonis]|jgi:hypothetical protein|uniref:hypothetical protein n=1 Tax=Pseudophaeobacter leonis TaxID=1144477 RepID=UPI0009F601FE|nr:hypothetical protein [Pseudophaeobacter leonis]
MPGKVKKMKKLKVTKPRYFVKLTDQTSPKFAHNAIAANKDVTWTYNYWAEATPNTRGSFELEMDLNKMKKKKENDQSRAMNDAAIAAVQKHVGPTYDVKLTSV